MEERPVEVDSAPRSKSEEPARRPVPLPRKKVPAVGEDAPEGAGEEAAASADTSLQVEVGHVTSLAVCFHVFLS